MEKTDKSLTITEKQISEYISSLMCETTNPNSVTTVTVLNNLQTQLGLNLSHKQRFIHNQIQMFKHHFTLHNLNTSQMLYQHPPYFPYNFQNTSTNIHYNNNNNNSNSNSNNGGVDFNFIQHPVQATIKTDSNVVPVKPKESAPTVTKRKGGAGGLNKVCGVSPELQTIVGEPNLSRTEIVKALWVYIRKHNLQDPSNMRKIICNDALRLVFETDATDMFKMNKLLSKHILPLGPTKETSHAKRTKVEVESVSPSSESGPPTVRISEALAKFLGTEERQMLQLDAMKLVWNYIKANQLEDPVNPMAILCDEKLRELLGCESISALGMSEMLMSCHLSSH